MPLSKKALLTLALVAALGVWAEGVGFWRQLPGSPVVGAPGQGLASTGERLYLAWGQDAQSAPQFWAYEPDDQAWTAQSVEGLPAGAFRAGTALAWDGDRYIYALGGAAPEDLNRRALFRFDLRQRRWVGLAETPHPQGAGNALAWDPFSQRLYALLGSERVDSAFARYNPSINRWETLPFPPGWDCTGAGTGLVSLRQFGVYALQGKCLERQELGRFAVYNPFRSAWTALAGLPQAVGAGGSLLWLGEFVEDQKTFMLALAGGLSGQPGFAVYRYNLDANFWFRLVDHTCPPGVYPGNRLGVVKGTVHFWQGAPADGAFACGGNALMQLLGITP